MKDVSLIVYPAADLTAAKRFFRELTGTGGMEIGLVPNADKREAAALAYWTVSDIAASVEALVGAGGTVVQEITDVAYGLLVASVKDPNGAIVGLRQPPKS